MYIEWEQKYNTGIKKIDKQHQKLVDLINRLHDKVVLKNDTSILLEAILEVKIYTIYHFSTEEKLFAKYNYTEDEQLEHIKMHQVFINEIALYIADNDTSKQELGYRLTEFLKNWLLSHILVSDKKFASFLNSNEIDIS